MCDTFTLFLDYPEFSRQNRGKHKLTTSTPFNTVNLSPLPGSPTPLSLLKQLVTRAHSPTGTEKQQQCDWCWDCSTTTRTARVISTQNAPPMHQTARDHSTPCWEFDYQFNSGTTIYNTGMKHVGQHLLATDVHRTTRPMQVTIKVAQKLHPLYFVRSSPSGACYSTHTVILSLPRHVSVHVHHPHAVVLHIYIRKQPPFMSQLHPIH
jgi:hypothetical protein